MGRDEIITQCRATLVITGIKRRSSITGAAALIP